MTKAGEGHNVIAPLLNRRDFVKATSAGAAGLVVGSAIPSMAAGATCTPSTNLPPLIDVHCHVFNGKDLPVYNFLRIVICGCYPQQVPALLPCPPCAITAWLVAQIRHWAPSAKKELRKLRRGRPSESVPTTGLTKEQIEIALEALLGEPDSMGDSAFDLHEIFEDLVSENKVPDKDIEKLKESVREEAQITLPFTPQMLGDAAETLSKSKGPVGPALRWIGLFTKERGGLANRLKTFYTQDHFEPALLVPGLVDFSKWLNQGISRNSRYRLQMELMAELSRRNDPPMHGYVAFDPLRAVFYKHKPNEIRPLDLVQLAIEKYGFLGVKLYPPMGFLPLKNKPHRPDKFAKFIRDALPGIDLRAELDHSLQELYEYCTANDVPIMAHASASIGSHPSYEEFTNPQYWNHALQDFSNLRLNVAHLGRFRDAEGDNFTKTFEWQFGNLIKRYPDAKLYADLSYLEQILTGADLDRVQRGLVAFIREFDPDVRHLMFGSDWTMIGLVDGHEHLARDFVAFLSRPESDGGVGLNKLQLSNLLRDNARCFLGLERGMKSLKRLESFYGPKQVDKFSKLCQELGLPPLNGDQEECKGTGAQRS